MATVLIVDDDCNMRILTSARLEGLFSVVCASDGEEALQIIRSGGIDLVIADIMMPKMDGFELLTAIRDEGNNIPFLLLTAKESLKDKQLGFSLGTDDYMTKPFSTDELIWRINALLRRANINRDKKIQIGNFVLDTESYTLHSKDFCIDFPKKEFDILFKLLSYPDRIFSKEELHDSIWGVNSESKEETVKTHINRIRNKLSNISEISIINIKGLGYKAEIQE